MEVQRESAPVKKTAKNGFLKSILVFTLIVSFSVLLLGGYWIFKGLAPRPLEVTNPKGEVLMTEASISGGQAVFQKYALMDYGTILGHGSYMGPDYTAEALKIYTEGMQNFKAVNDYGKSFNKLSDEEKSVVRDRVIREMRKNRYDSDSKTLELTQAQVYGLNKVRSHYRDVFTNGDGWGIEPGLIQERHMPDHDRAWVANEDQITQVSDFMFWTAWLASTLRPNDDITYTNNWPYDEEAGNTMSFSAVWWSGASVTILILFVGIILFLFYRYKLGMKEAYKEGEFPVFRLENQPLTASQVKTGKYFAVVSLLFFIQAMLGALLAHYYVEPDSFFGIDWIREVLPFSISKGYHLQLAIFWIATAWLGMGIFVAPLVGGREPKKQGLLVDILFWALIFLVGGSVVGEWLGAKGYLGNNWFLFGHQGMEYIELGRFWQIILALGMLIWLFIVFRGIKSGLKKESDKGGLIHLLFYSSIAIPLFYGAAFLFNPGTSITMSDFWRWWIIHLWVEGIFEVFAVVVIGFLLVQMNLVTKKSTVRSLYFQLTLLLGSGVIGIGHHYYYNGSSEVWIGLGSVFSCLEVIPLTLLVLEAYEQYKMMRDGGNDFPYKATFWFLISTAIWNLVGAGVLGFLINLPVVSYFEHGQFLTPAHGHGAMMGVYGMFAIAVWLYSLRNIVKPQFWNDKLLKIACWGLNIGLFGMVFMSLLPIGFIQLKKAFEDGYWSSRAPEFLQQDVVQTLLTLRSIPDTIFLISIVLLAYFTVKSLFHLRKPTHQDGEELPVKDIASED
ncbi:nitric-oxide reductase large subunit [Bacillus sonorensis]|uniref:Nitric-oxide reductase n=2 Tax=Bacillus sonorensis TaxID=119858 RepID=M5PGE2_9BACI|nr:MULTISPECIES: nitric-oxide reductase large subunit [Bacillus]TWK84301.1 Nitric oxide reductase subunit B [Bacillus paralicheniformis]ASB89078.1 Nitric-oxide reductase (cytochrome c) [Bacillus sonorensis]EME75697.1 nitric-oxide reductase [Bacillus sonorensis L12]MBG9915039.1 nitric oxide reductase [Bacillus sonorensis]MCY8026934.1 nitric-oxide reductase large subunit [Bacillus sonorensis]